VDGQVVALDVGGTRIKTALISHDGTPRRVETVPTGRGRGPEAVVDHVLDVAARLCDDEAADGRPPRAVGLTLPGIVDETSGVAAFSANVGWRDVPIGRLLSERLGVPAVLCHDVRAAALAESRLGVGAGTPSFVFVAIGTGIGGALVLDGRIHRGAGHRAGEIGHVVVAPDGPPCGCGARGCVETLASARAIEHRYARRTGSAGVDAEEVARRVAAGDRLAAEIWADAVHALALGLMTCVTLVDPGLVVIGGGLAEAGATLLDPLAAALAERATFQVPPRTVTTRLGELAGCQGAGLAAWDLVHTGGAAGTAAVA
jgi:glucokinase